MKLVKADLHDLNATQMVAKGEFVVERMTGNANFLTPTPTLPSVTAAIDVLRIANAEAEGGAHAAIDARDLALVGVRDLLTALCAYVNFTSGTDLAVAITSGFEPVNVPAPIILEAPVNMRAMYADGFAGCVDTKWRHVAGATIYHVFVGEGDPAAAKFTLAGASTRARLRVSGLERGKVYSFYVVALGAAGVGPASEIVTNRAA
ncbi:MAG: fibronectin type III domain-containing protein [Flavobacteriales bacterium]|nr:fibronectin type III domain-containing protein [Flavobacteriales bacterium]